MSFYNRLQEVMKEKNIRQVDMTRDLGITSANFYQWKKGSAPRNDALLKIAEYLGVSRSYLLELTDSRDSDNLINPQFTVYDVCKVRMIPLFDLIPDVDDIFEEQRYISGNVCCSDNLTTLPDLFAFVEVSNTMSPIISPGDTVIAQCTDMCKNGDLCIYRLYGNTGVRWLSETDTDYILEAANLYNKETNQKGYKTISLPKDKLDDFDFRIIGKVLEIRKPERNLRRY